MDFNNDEILRKHAVRLFPTVHISSGKEAEMRATASLLAMIRAVSEFGRSIVRKAGCPAGTSRNLSCFTEVEIDVPDSEQPEKLRPDGIIRFSRGGKTKWKALVEVKVGSSDLDQEQIHSYQKLAKNESFNALITISNQAAKANLLPPVKLLKVKSVCVSHFSWEHLLEEARAISLNKAVKDPDQQWMLDEWILYVSDPDSKIIEPPYLGMYWNDILKSARKGNLREDVEKLKNVAEHWVGFLRKVAFRLRALLGVEVEVKMTRNERNEPKTRIKRIVDSALNNDCLLGEFRIPNTAGNLQVEIDLKAKRTTYSISTEPPQKKTQKGQLSWLIRQLKRFSYPPADLEVTVIWKQGGIRSQSDIGKILEDNAVPKRDTNGNLILTDNLPKEFRLEWTKGFPKRQGRSGASVLEGISNDLRYFYESIVEKIEPIVPPVPKTPKEMAGTVMDNANDTSENTLQQEDVLQQKEATP